MRLGILAIFLLFSTPTFAAMGFRTCRDAQTDSECALLEAAERGDQKTFDALRTDLKSIRFRSSFYRENPLHYAVRGDQAEFIRENRPHAESLLFARNRYGMNPLQLALSLGNRSTVKALADYASAKDILHLFDDKDKFDSYHYAVMTNDSEIMSMILQIAPKNDSSRIYWVGDRFKRSPFYLCAVYNLPNALSAILANCQSPDITYIAPALQKAAAENFPKITAQLLAIPQSSPNALDLADESHRTPLMLAAQHYDSEIVTQLLQAGANVGTTDTESATALHYAARNQSAVNVRMLLNAKSAVDSRNKSLETPLHISAHEGFADVTKVLLEAKTDVNVKDANGRTPLIRAAISRYTDIVEQLVKAGADINIADHNGMNAAMYATENLSTEIVRFLLREGINVNQQDKRGRYLLQIAEEANNDAVTRMLKNAEF